MVRRVHVGSNGTMPVGLGASVTRWEVTMVPPSATPKHKISSPSTNIIVEHIGG